MEINLLPLKAKTELFEEEVGKLIIILGVLILIFLFSLTLILFSVKSHISGQVGSQKTLVDLEKKQFEIPETQTIREKIILINQNLLKLNSFYQEQINLTETFKKISEILPPEMYLTVFSYQKETFQISLSGFAPNRETLFEFKKNLEKEFPDSYFPPQNWIKSTDIDFQVNFKIF
ncbi:PilN domain-containing protein [Patescibacteria group bacterium]|nr:PilN domain-containing protein [Patescibacteria group bacterium]